MSIERALLATFRTRLGSIELVTHSATPWFSATFGGTNYAFLVEIEQTTDVADFAREIAEADIALPRGFVADISVGEIERGDRRRIEINVLTIDA